MRPKLRASQRTSDRFATNIQMKVIITLVYGVACFRKQSNWFSINHTLIESLLFRTQTCIRTVDGNNLKRCNALFVKNIFLPIKQHEMYSQNYIFIE